METTFSWAVSYLESAPSENGLEKVIKNIYWRRTGQQELENGESISSSSNGIANCSSPNPDDFIPYDNVTEEMVFQWLDSILNTEVIDEGILRDIEIRKNPPIVQYPLPWEYIPTSISE